MGFSELLGNFLVDVMPMLKKSVVNFFDAEAKQERLNRTLGTVFSGFCNVATALAPLIAVLNKGKK